MQRVILYVCCTHSCQIWSEPGYVWERQLGRGRAEQCTAVPSRGIMHHSPVWPNKARQGNICSCFQTGQKYLPRFVLCEFWSFAAKKKSFFVTTSARISPHENKVIISLMQLVYFFITNHSHCIHLLSYWIYLDFIYSQHHVHCLWAVHL